MLTGLGNLDRVDAFKDVHAGSLNELWTELRVLCGGRRPGEPRAGTQMRKSFLQRARSFFVFPWSVLDLLEVAVVVAVIVVIVGGVIVDAIVVVVCDRHHHHDRRHVRGCRHRRRCGSHFLSGTQIRAVVSTAGWGRGLRRHLRGGEFRGLVVLSLASGDAYFRRRIRHY